MRAEQTPKSKGAQKKKTKKTPGKNEKKAALSSPANKA
jgi:hypothetical protein